MFKNFPAPLTQKIYLTLIVGIGCLILGVSYFVMMHDKTFLFLSIFIASAIKTISFYRIAKNKQYEVVSGTCVFIAPVLLGKFLKVKIMDDDGIETTLNLAKGTKLKIGEKYNLYFSQRNTKITDNNLVNTLVATDNFLGLEKVL